MGKKGAKGTDEAFEECSYRCSRCGCEVKVNEAIIDAGISWAKFNKTYYKGFMPVLRYPNCKQETMEYERNAMRKALTKNENMV